MLIKIIIYGLLAVGLGALLYLPVRRVVNALLKNLKEGETAVRLDETLNQDSMDDIVDDARQTKQRIGKKTGSKS